MMALPSGVHSSSSSEVRPCIPESAKNVFLVLAVALTIITVLGGILCTINPSYVNAHLTAFAASTAVAGVITLALWALYLIAKKSPHQPASCVPPPCVYVSERALNVSPPIELWKSQWKRYNDYGEGYEADERLFIEAMKTYPQQLAQFVRGYDHPRDEFTQRMMLNRLYQSVQDEQDKTSFFQVLAFSMLGDVDGSDKHEFTTNFYFLNNLGSSIPDNYCQVIGTLMELADPINEETYKKILFNLLGQAFLELHASNSDRARSCKISGEYETRARICVQAANFILTKNDPAKIDLMRMREGFQFLERFFPETNPNWDATRKKFYELILKKSHGIYDDLVPQKFRPADSNASRSRFDDPAIGALQVRAAANEVRRSQAEPREMVAAVTRAKEKKAQCLEEAKQSGNWNSYWDNYGGGESVAEALKDDPQKLAMVMKQHGPHPILWLIRNPNYRDLSYKVVAFYILGKKRFDYEYKANNENLYNFVMDHYVKIIPALAQLANPNDKETYKLIVRNLLDQIFWGIERRHLKLKSIPIDADLICRYALNDVLAKIEDKDTRINLMAEGFYFIKTFLLKPPLSRPIVEIAKKFYPFVLNGSEGIYDHLVPEAFRPAASNASSQNGPAASTSPKQG